MNGWRDLRLKDLCTDAGQYGLNISADSYVPHGVRLLRTTDISSGVLAEADSGVYVDCVPEERFALAPGDLLLSRSGTPPGQSYLVRSADAGMTFAGYLVRFRPRPDVDPRFVAYVARSAPFQHTIHAESVSSTIQNFNAERYANMRFAVPDSAQQRRIAEFLDVETARIDEIDRLNQRLTTLLKERRQAVMDHAVSTSSPVMAKLFWRLTLLRDGTHQPPPRVNAGVPLLTARNVSSGTLRLTDADTYVSEDDADVLERSLRLQVGDVLLSVKGTIGACAVTPLGFPRAVLDRNVAVLRPAVGHSSEWLAIVLSSTALQEQMRIAVTAAAQPGLPLGVIRELRIPDVHPNMQSVLAEKVCSKFEAIDRAIECLARKRELLAERRQALITAAVAGHFDVLAASGRNVTQGVSA